MNALPEMNSLTNRLCVAVWVTFCTPALASSFERRPLLRTDGKPIALTMTATSEDAAARQPELTLADARAGRYVLSWKGADGQKKEITYFEPDRVKVLVNASVAAGSTRKYAYRYEVHSDQASGQDVYGFVIQTFGTTPVVVVPKDDRYIGEMTSSVPEFANGRWYRIPLESGELSPGKTALIVIESDSEPGLVQLRVHGGPLGIKGIGEEPPSGFEASLPRYEAWPLGLTIGPVEDFSDANYRFGKGHTDAAIAAMTTAGWMNEATKARYVQLINEASNEELMSTITADSDAGTVAPEVGLVTRRLIAL